MKILLAEFKTKLKPRIKNLSDLRKSKILNKLLTHEGRSSRLQSNNDIGTLVRDCTDWTKGSPMKYSSKERKKDLCGQQ